MKKPGPRDLDRATALLHAFWQEPELTFSVRHEPDVHIARVDVTSIDVRLAGPVGQPS